MHAHQEPRHVLPAGLDHLTSLVDGLLDGQRRQDVRRRDPDGVHREVASGADPSAEPEGRLQRTRRVFVERALRGEVPGRIECVRVGVSSLVVENSPACNPCK